MRRLRLGWRRGLLGAVMVLGVAGLAASITGCPPPPALVLLVGEEACFTWFNGFQPGVESLRTLTPVRLTNTTNERVYYTTTGAIPFGYVLDPSQGWIEPGETARPMLKTFIDLGRRDPDPFYLGLHAFPESAHSDPAFKALDGGQTLKVPVIGSTLSASLLDPAFATYLMMISEPPDDKGPFFEERFMPHLIGKARNHSDLTMTPRIPLGFTEIIGSFADDVEYDSADEWIARFQVQFKGKGVPMPPFPCGSGPNGFTVCPEFDAGNATDTDYLLVTQVLQEDVPIDDPTRSFQYGFVFDSDGDPDNNFQASPAFEGDLFQGTDKWYSLQYSPADGWILAVTNATSGQNPQSAFSSARAVINGNAITLVVPYSELPVLADDNKKGIDLLSILFRVTAFSYIGNFNNEWSSDYCPEVDELERIRLVRPLT